MPQPTLLSAKEAINMLLPGGKWGVATALSIAGTTEGILQCPESYRSVELYGNADFYVNFNIASATGGIATANDLIMPSSQRHSVILPYDIGVSTTGDNPGVVLHVQQVGTVAGKTVRVVLR